MTEARDRAALPGLLLPEDAQLLVIAIRELDEEKKKKINTLLGELGVAMDAQIVVLDQRVETFMNLIQQDLDRAKHVGRTGDNARLIQYATGIRDQLNRLLDYLHKKEKKTP